MGLDKLLKDRVIEKTAPDKKAAEKSFTLSERDIKTAKSMLKAENYDYRPYSEHKHVAVIEFVHDLFGEEISNKMINIFDRMRKKRHRIVYEEAGIVTQDEAEQSVRWAEEFVQKVRAILETK